MTDRIRNATVMNEVLSFLGIVSEARAITISGVVAKSLGVSIPRAYRMTLSALRRLRARRIVERSGARGASYYSLTQQKAVAS